MADILSLSKARKAKALARKDAETAENRVKFGRTRAEREREAAAKALDERRADGHKRED